MIYSAYKRPCVCCKLLTRCVIIIIFSHRYRLILETNYRDICYISGYSIHLPGVCSVYRFGKLYITTENFYKTLIFFYGMFFVRLDFSWKKFSCMSWWNFYVQHIIPNRKKVNSSKKKERRKRFDFWEKENLHWKQKVLVHFNRITHWKKKWN